MVAQFGNFYGTLLRLGLAGSHASQDSVVAMNYIKHSFSSCIERRCYIVSVIRWMLSCKNLWCDSAYCHQPLGRHLDGCMRMKAVFCSSRLEWGFVVEYLMRPNLGALNEELGDLQGLHTIVPGKKRLTVGWTSYLSRHLKNAKCWR